MFVTRSQQNAISFSATYNLRPMSHTTSYDPDWLVALLRTQRPDYPRVAEAMAKCRKALATEPGYITFVNPSRPNLPGSEWQFDGNIDVSDPVRGWIVFDLLNDGRIGGVEFVDEIPIEPPDPMLQGSTRVQAR
jgi:hypothetical protein